MAKYRTVHTSFWDDTKVIDEFTSDDKYLFLYILTNQKANQIGCYELPISQIMRDTRLSKSKIEKIFQKFEEKLQVIVYDYETKEVFIKNWHKYNWLNSVLTKKCIEKEYEMIKSDYLKELISPLYGAYVKKQAPTKEEKEKEKEEENKKKKNEGKEKEEENTEAPSSFPPTLSEIISYASNEMKLDNQDYCEKFYNHYSGIGWVNGTGQEIIDWKSVFKNWIKKDKKEKADQEETIPQVGSTKGLQEL